MNNQALTFMINQTLKNTDQSQKKFNYTIKNIASNGVK